MIKPETLSVAVVQSDIIWGRCDQNLRHYEGLLQRLTRNIHLVVLPETFATGFMASPDRISVQNQKIITEWMRQQAMTHKCALCGTVMITENDNLFNRFYFVQPDGRIHFYDKRHLFNLSVEKELFSVGNKRVIVHYLGWNFFPQICYDLRFPVWQRNIWHQGRGYEYDVMLLCANWPASRSNAWDILLQARAVENQSYVIAVNRIGKDGMHTAHNGHSKIVDFAGEIMMQAENDCEDILICTLQKEPLERYRQKFPFGEDQDQAILL